MTPDAGSGEAGAGMDAPSMLELVRLSPRRLFPPGGLDLYRHIALLADLSEGDEVLVAGSGNGVTLEYFVVEHEVQGSGVDFDARMVEKAEDRARGRDLATRLQFQHAPLDRLPYRDSIFDLSVGELVLTAGADPGRAVGELVRVTRPGGTVILVQPVWKAPVDERRRAVLSEHLGLRPLMLVEWKRLLKAAGVVQIHTEDWSDPETAFRAEGVKPFPDFAELFSLSEKIGILRRAWRQWGWNGVRNVVLRERAVHRLLTKERILGLDLLKGTVPEPDPELEAAEGGAARDAAQEVPGEPPGTPGPTGEGRIP